MTPSIEISSRSEQVRLEVDFDARSGTLKVDGQEVACDWVRLPDGQYSLILGGRVYDLSVGIEGEECNVSGREGKSEFYVTDPRRLRANKPVEEGHSGLRRICADMPGKVIRVLVQAGEAVVWDQGLLVLEAMKMQNEIRATRSGTVKEIAVEAGKAVNTGDFLLSLE